MIKKMLTLLFAPIVVFPLASAVFAQVAPAQPKEARWEGKVIRTNPEQSNLTVRKVDTTNDERIVRYDSSTRWVSQAHGSTKANDIDASQVKEGDRVICTGTWDKAGVLHATLISRRLSHSPE
jgi:hypothetical protein